MPEVRRVRSAFDGAYVNADVACHGCGYNLRGLPVTGRCPECSAPVRVALAGDMLHFADPAWLDRLDRGARLVRPLLIWGGFAPLVIGVAAFYLPNSGKWLPYVAGAASLLIATVFMRGMWLFASPDPAGGSRTWKGDPAVHIRFALVALLVTVAITVMVRVMSSSQNAWLWVQLLGAPLGASGLVGALATCAFGMELARRIGDAFLFDRIELYRTAYLVSWLWFAGGVTAQFAIGKSVLGLACLLGGLGMLGFGALILSLPTMLAKGIKANRNKAERLWSTALEDATE